MNNPTAVLKAYRRKNTPAYEVWRRFTTNKMALSGLVVMIVATAMAIFAPWLTPYDYKAQDYGATLLFPNSKHWFGTDNFGRDILSRVIYGSRYTLFIGITVTSVSAFLGSALGLFAAFYPKLDNVIMRIVDIFMGIPHMCFCLAIIAAMGSNMTNMMFALIVTGAPGFARVMRAQVLTVREQEFIEAAYSIGASNFRIMVKHILPNSLAPIIVQFTLGMVNVILMSASLSFIGMGVQPPTPEWGLLISSGRAYLRDYWYMSILPGMAIVVTTFALNLLGDGLRDALDPRLKR